MRTTKRHIRQFLFLWAALSIVGIVAAQVITSKNPIAAWTAPTKNADGTPLTDLDHYIVAVSSQPLAEPTSAEGAVIMAVGGATQELDLTPMLASLNAPPPYWVWVRAVDKFGNEGGWTDAVNFTPDTVPPDKPTGLHIKVKTTTTTTVETTVEQP